MKLSHGDMCTVKPERTNRPALKTAFHGRDDEVDVSLALFRPQCLKDSARGRDRERVALDVVE